MQIQQSQSSAACGQPLAHDQDKDTDRANVLVFPDAECADLAYNLLSTLATHIRLDPQRHQQGRAGGARYGPRRGRARRSCGRGRSGRKSEPAGRSRNGRCCRLGLWRRSRNLRCRRVATVRECCPCIEEAMSPTTETIRPPQSSASVPRLGSVLVATDFSPASEKAVLCATAVARRQHAPIVLFHVVNSQSERAVMDGWRAGQAEVMSHLLADHLDGLQYELLVRTGAVCDALEQVIAERNVGFVVLGTRGQPA